MVSSPALVEVLSLSQAVGGPSLMSQTGLLTPPQGSLTFCSGAQTHRSARSPRPCRKASFHRTLVWALVPLLPSLLPLPPTLLPSLSPLSLPCSLSLS